MRGLITHREVLANFGLIWREFGPRCMARCLVAIVTRRPTTFLDLAMGARLSARSFDDSRDPLDIAGDGWGSC